MSSETCLPLGQTGVKSSAQQAIRERARVVIANGFINSYQDVQQNPQGSNSADRPHT